MHISHQLFHLFKRKGKFNNLPCQMLYADHCESFMELGEDKWGNVCNLLICNDRERMEPYEIMPMFDRACLTHWNILLLRKFRIRLKEQIDSIILASWEKNYIRTKGCNCYYKLWLSFIFPSVLLYFAIQFCSNSRQFIKKQGLTSRSKFN